MIHLIDVTRKCNLSLSEAQEDSYEGVDEVRYMQEVVIESNTFVCSTAVEYDSDLVRLLVAEYQVMWDVPEYRLV